MHPSLNCSPIDLAIEAARIKHTVDTFETTEIAQAAIFPTQPCARDALHLTAKAAIPLNLTLLAQRKHFTYSPGAGSTKATEVTKQPGIS